jgi:hypothetical protein
MFNVGAIVGFDAGSVGLPDRIDGAKPVAGLGRVLEIGHPSPVVFSERLVFVDSDTLPDRPILWEQGFWDGDNPTRDRVLATLEDVLQGTAYSPTTGTARALYVRGAPSAANPALPSDGRRRAVEIDRWLVSDTGAQLDLRSERAGWLQIAHPWYPSLAVSHNGERVVPLQSAFGLIVVPVVAGANSYVVHPTLSPLRRLTSLVAVVGFVVISVGIVRRPSADRGQGAPHSAS